MPALWPAFQSSVAPFLEDASKKSFKQTAKKIADEYHTAVATANIVLIPGNVALKRPSPRGIEKAIEKILVKTHKSGKKLKPADFQQWANEVVKYWGKVIPNPALAATPKQVNKVLNSGVAATLQTALYAAFNNPPVNTPMGNIICTKMIAAFSAHLATISGLYDGALAPPAPPTPTPFPWVGVA
jgi:hypothetical protein